MAQFRLAIARALFALLIIGGSLSSSMQAQNDAVTVTVPFRFAVGTHSNAPGTYHFSLESSQYLLSVTNVKTGDVEMFDVRPERQSKFERRGHLIFRDSSGHNVLHEVHFPHTDTFAELIDRHPASRTETARSGMSHSSSAGQR